MKIETINAVLSFVGILGCSAIAICLVFFVSDLLDVYLKFRKHVLNGDLAKRKDRE
jgi:hypothetical protein